MQIYTILSKSMQVFGKTRQEYWISTVEKVRTCLTSERRALSKKSG